MAILTKAMDGNGVSCATPIDAFSNPDYNLLNAGFVGILLSCLVDLLHLAPPFSTFSAIANGFIHSQMRSIEFPGGLPGLDETKMQKVRLGNALAEVAAVLIRAQFKAGNLYQLEQPAKSLLVHFPSVRSALDESSASGFRRDACADGAPW